MRTKIKFALVLVVLSVALTANFFTGLGLHPAPVKSETPTQSFVVGWLSCAMLLGGLDVVERARRRLPET